MLTTCWLPQALGPWLTAIESITTGERSSVQEWYWIMMGMPRLTRLELGISLRNMRLILLTKLTQLTSLSLNMSVDSDRREDEDECWINPDALRPLSALRQLRELRMIYSSVPHIPPGVWNLSSLVYLEFHTLRDPNTLVLPALTRLTQLQALVLRGTAVDMRTLTLESGLTRLVNLRVLMVNSWPVRGHTFTNNFAAFSMSCLQVLDLSLPDGSRMPTHWLASMHQLSVLAVCSNTLAGALPTHIVPLLKILIISEDEKDPLPDTQPVLHVDTLPSLLDRMNSPDPLTVMCRRTILVGKMPAAQVRTLSSNHNFLIVNHHVPVKRIHQQLALKACVCRLVPCLKQLCDQLPYLAFPPLSRYIN